MQIRLGFFFADECAIYHVAENEIYDLETIYTDMDGQETCNRLDVGFLAI